MLESKITILKGDRSSGRTTFLIEIIKTLLSIKKQVLFLDIYGESEYLTKLYDSDYLKYYKLNDSQNLFVFDILEEKITTNHIEYIFIDDIEFNDNDIIEKLFNCVNRVSECNAVIVSSDDSFLDKFIKKEKKFSQLNLDTYKIESHWDDSSLKTELRLIRDDLKLDKSELKSLILSKFRGKKIDSVLGED
jgi:hypothetical protein